MIGLSTAWVGPKRPTVEETIRRAVEAGFSAIELGAWGEMPPVDRLVALGRELPVTYTSVHNIAYRAGMPGDEVFGDGLSSEDRAARQRAVDATTRSAELARAVGARFVVIHAGNVSVPEAIAKQSRLQELLLAGRRREAQKLMAQLHVERSALAAPAVEAAAASLAEVFRRTGDFPMAVECRVHYHSIPQPGELDFLMTVLGGRPIYYWHDVGHARVGELLGLTPALAWLRRFRGKLAGIHLHDVKGFRDHRVPGTGDVDFKALAPYLNDNVVKIMELPPFPSAEELRKGRARLEAAGIA
jgi:sugar phosphate isomerase/epimerase